MIKDEMLFIDGLQLCKWDRELLLDMREGGINCIHASIGLWENARETLSNIGQWNAVVNQTIREVKSKKKNQNAKSSVGTPAETLEETAS